MKAEKGKIQDDFSWKGKLQTLFLYLALISLHKTSALSTIHHKPLKPNELLYILWTVHSLAPVEDDCEGSGRQPDPQMSQHYRKLPNSLLQ